MNNSYEINHIGGIPSSPYRTHFKKVFHSSSVRFSTFCKTKNFKIEVHFTPSLSVCDMNMTHNATTGILTTTTPNVSNTLQNTFICSKNQYYFHQIPVLGELVYFNLTLLEDDLSDHTYVGATDTNLNSKSHLVHFKSICVGGDHNISNSL
tara:strand:- start:21318 stop:21770 length:453 start_codon:yes stop_codon:yes gene_type:complete